MGENPRAAFCTCSQHLSQAPCGARRGSYQWNVGASDAIRTRIKKAPKLYSLSLFSVSLCISLCLSQPVCHGVVKALGCLEPEPSHMPQGAWERCSEEGQEGPLGLSPVSNPSTGGRYPIWGLTGTSARVHGSVSVLCHLLLLLSSNLCSLFNGVYPVLGFCGCKQVDCLATECFSGDTL